MKDDWFEDKMNERFENFDSDLDLHAAWSDLELRRKPKKEKKRVGIIWWFGTGVVVGLIGIIAFFYFNKQTRLFEEDKTPLAEINFKANSPESQQKLADCKINENKDEKYNVIKDKSFTQGNIIKKKTLEKLNNYSKKLNKNNDIVFESKDVSSSINAPTLSFSKKEKETKKITTYAKVDKLYSPIFPIAILEKNIPFLTVESTLYNMEDNLQEITNYSHAFGIAFNYGKAFRSSPIGRGINSAYLLKRDGAETPLDSWSAQVFYQLKNKKNWFAQFSTAYSQTTDLFEDNYTASSKIIIDEQILQINRYTDGSTEEIRGSAVVIKEEKNSGKFYQRYRQVLVGLEFGKEINLRSEFNLRASLGGDFVLYQSNSGKIFSNENATFGDYQDLTSISSKTSGIFAAKLNVEIGKVFGIYNEISIGLIAKSNLNILENDLGRRQYLLSTLSYRKNF